VEYIESGKPIIGLRTATHAFNLDSKSRFRNYTWNYSTEPWQGGFGKRVLGETWVSHHGQHGRQSCRGIIPDSAAHHPIVRGIRSGDIWGPTDVYGVRLPLPGDSFPLVLGAVLKGMKPTDDPVEGPLNNPMMPIAWTKTYTGAAGKAARVFTTTMGASQDFQSEGLRRLLVNAVYWSLGLEEQIPAKGTQVDLVGEFHPSPFAFNGFRKGVKPSDHAWKPE
jgi:hypothetical protein